MLYAFSARGCHLVVSMVSGLMTKERVSLNLSMNRSSTLLSVLPGSYPVFR